MSRLAAPGSLLWLLVWDLRIRLREHGRGRARWRAGLLYGAAAILLHAVAAVVLASMLARGRPLPQQELISLCGLLLLSLQFFMLMAAGLSGFRLLHAARELTPLLASPLPFARVLWMRVLGLVLTSWSVSILLVVPVANVGALLGSPRFLLAYPVTIAMAALTTAVVLLVVSGVVRRVGVARGRRLLQWLQALVPILFVLASFAGHGGSEAGRGLERQAWLMQLPARAVTGDRIALAALLALAAAALALAARLAAHALQAVLQAPEVPVAARAAEAGQPLRFQAGLLRLICLKEWRTILREPRLAAALLVQPLLVVPLFYGGLMRGQLELAGFATMAVLVAGQLSQYVANLMISAEEAPALLAGAPQPRSRLIRLKCVAVLLPIVVVMLLAAAVLAIEDPWCGLVAAACSTAAAFCACAVEVVRPYPAPRRSFVSVGTGQRWRDPLDLLGIAALQIGWASAAWLLARHSHWGALIVLAVLLVPFLQWWRDANRQTLLGY